MGVLGHLTKEERESLWETFEKKLKTGTPVLIGVLNKKFLSVPIGTANYAQTECQFRYCGTAIPFLTVRSTAR